MVHRLLYSTALVLSLSGAAMAGTAAAQDTTADPAAQPPPAEDMTTGTDMAPAGEDVGAVEEPAAEPPPEGVVIEMQEPSQDRAADQLIGMSVMGGNDQKIGSAEDLLIDDKKQVTGVIISVGGFLGIGSKSVAINWDEVEVRENPDTGSTEMVVNWTKEELQAAPAFKTTEDQEAEAAAQQMQQEQMQQDTAPQGGVTQ